LTQLGRQQSGRQEGSLPQVLECIPQQKEFTRSPKAFSSLPENQNLPENQVVLV
jgi:hypothetical protein